MDPLSLLVFREGERTEEDYLLHWRRIFRDRTVVEIDPVPSGPLQLVQRAIKAKNQGVKDQRRGKGRAHDQIWCMFDRDEHANFDEAVALANSESIRLAISVPCIELWFILHFRDQYSYLDRNRAQAESRGLLRCEKSLSADALLLLERGANEAKVRALNLDAKHQGDGSPPLSNPSSTVWQLTDAIRSGK